MGGGVLRQRNMKLRRLRNAGVAELAYRGRQEASKWLDRMGIARWTNGSVRFRNGDLALSASMLLGRFLENGPARFFQGAVSHQTPFLLPNDRDPVLSAADAVCRGRFDVLGYRGLSFGTPTNWHLDPISGRQAPTVHWSRIHPLDPAMVGDSKVIWELNRHQWLVLLGQAYQFTGDERYAEKFAESIRDWMRANPRGIGVNWAGSLEVALRLISWCWAMFLFRRSKALSPELFIEMLGGIEAHAEHVERYLSTYFSPNTHLTGEALGLFYAGVVFPEWRPAGRWRALGMKILEEQVVRQVFPDGVHFEQAACYHRYTIEIYLHFLILSERNGITVAPAVRERVRRMLDFLLAVVRPDGTMPQIGDADGGWLLPLSVRTPDDVRGVFSTAAALLGRPEYAWAAGGPAPETVWLMGTAGLTAFDALRPAPPARSPSVLFEQGGYAVMRNGWDADAHHLIFDVGPLGCPVSGGHGHADLLSIQCAAYGESYLVDPGTYRYTGEPDWRDFFRTTAAHSTVMIDGADQAVPDGPFAWKHRPRARLRRWISNEAFDFADAEHDGYRRLPDPVVHRRRVLFVKPRYWVVVDDLEGAAEHRVELRFQLGPVIVTMDRDPWIQAGGSGRRGLLIRAFAPIALKTEIREGENTPIQGWVSPDYGQRRPAPVLIYSAVTRLPLRIVTLLFPMENPSGPPPDITVSVEEQEVLWESKRFSLNP
jgi:hypothetical protein